MSETNVKKCKSCGQDLPQLDDETLKKFKIMLDLWFKTLMENKD